MSSPDVVTAQVLDRLKGLRRWWNGVVGADAYERYLDFHRRSGCEVAPMTAKEFWRDKTDSQDLNPKTRCC